jgi:pseudouridine-5'-monophosphatase
VYIVLVTSSRKESLEVKTRHLEELFSYFEERRRVLGDEVRIPKGRGKPMPDIYSLAFKL